MSSDATVGTPSHLPSANTFTAARYAEAVHEFVRQPTGVGQNHETLSRFLRRIPPGKPTNGGVSSGPFLKLYAFSREMEDSSQSARGPSRAPMPHRNFRMQDKRRKRRWTLGNPRKFFDCTTFEAYQLPTKAESPSQIILLSGFPTAEWLSVVGAKYKVDPELPARFLHFQSTGNSTETFALPPLPASSWNILELPTVTIGGTSVLKKFALSQVTAIRDEANGLLRKHHNRLTGQPKFPELCSSIVRNVTVLDHSHFAIEQRIWICLQPKQGTNAWFLVIWTDSGDNGNETSLRAIWDVLPRDIRMESPFLIPATRYKPNTGLYSHIYPSFESPLTAPRLLRGLETGTLVHIGFGRTLRSDLMSKDALYCLTEVIGLAATSENQFLNLVEQKLIEYTDDEHFGDVNMLPSLTYVRNILYRHRGQTRGVLDWLRTYRTPQWPITNDKNAVRSRENVQQEYDHLLDRACALVAQCQDAITVLMNTTAIQESRKGIEQSVRMKKLAFLAFIFAPLSFTTSFFSMNVVEFGDLKIWQWTIMTVGLTVSALVFSSTDIGTIWLALKQMFADMKIRF